MKPVIVVSLGGSLINSGEVQTTFLKNFKRFIMRRREDFIVICGGGINARQYTASAKKLGITKFNELDKIAMNAVMLNAELVAGMFKTKVYTTPKKISFRKILVAGAWKPGASSDFDAVLWAEKFGVNAVVNLTNIDYVYSKDPKIKGAVPLKHLSWSKYRLLIPQKWKTGMNVPFDPIASQRAHKLKLTVVTLNGRNLDNFGKCLDGKKFKGTIIHEC